MRGEVDGLALCAGIGGLELGIKLALGDAYRCVGHVERDAFATSILLARMEDESLERAPVWCGNLEDLDASSLPPRVDLVSAGYPCQPFSVAGKRAGTTDARWVWPEIARIIRLVRPRFVFLENVPGHLRLGFDAVLGNLAELGFDAEWDLFSAAGVGAPHRRQRLFVLAYRSSKRRQQERRGSPGDEGANEGGDEDAVNEPSGRGESLGHPRCSGLEEREGGPVSGSFPSPWPPGPGGDWSRVPTGLEPALRRVADGLPHMLHSALDEAECRSKASAARYYAAWKKMQRVRLDALSSPPSPGSLKAPGCRDPLREMPQSSPPTPAEGAVRGLWPNVQAAEAFRLHALWRSEVQERAWNSVSPEEVGGSPDNPHVRVVRDGVLAYEGTSENLRALLRKRDGLVQARVDRIRVLGNAVVPLVAAHAFRTLAARMNP